MNTLEAKHPNSPPKRRRPNKRRFLVCLAVAVAALAALYCILIYVVIPVRIKAAIEKEGFLKSALMAQCSRVRFSLLPTSVCVEDVAVFDPSITGEARFLVKADRLRARISLGELISRRMKPVITVERPWLRLACDGNGVWNVSAFRRTGKKGVASRRQKKRGKRKPRRQIENAEIFLTDGSLEIIDGKLDGAKLTFSKVSGLLDWRNRTVFSLSLTASVAQGRMKLSGTRISPADKDPSARMQVSASGLKPDKELAPFLRRMFPKTSLKGFIDFTSDVTLCLTQSEKGGLKVNSIKGSGNWDASLGILRGPETPDYIEALIPGLSLSNFSFYEMRGEFFAFGPETAAEMDIIGENAALHIRGSNKINGAMKYVLFLDLNRTREQRALAQLKQSGPAGPPRSASKPSLSTDREDNQDFGRLQLLTFQAIMDKKARLKEEKAVFATEDMVLQFIKANYGSFANYLSELKSLRRED